MFIYLFIILKYCLRVCCMGVMIFITVTAVSILHILLYPNTFTFFFLLYAFYSKE